MLEIARRVATVHSANPNLFVDVLDAETLTGQDV
jgi:hypothetical protein